MVDIVRHLLTPPFGTETTERLLMERAAAEITRLREENARLRAALKPFAEVAKRDIGESETDDDRFRPLTYNRAPHITVGHLRAAAAAIRERDAKSE